MSDSVVLYKSYLEGSAALLDREVLDAEGIPYFVSGDSLLTAYPMAGQNFGVVQLHIYESDLERVELLLSHAREALMDDASLRDAVDSDDIDV